MHYLDILAGFIASALAAMGVGGGGLLVIYLTKVARMEQRGGAGREFIILSCGGCGGISRTFTCSKARLEVCVGVWYRRRLRRGSRLRIGGSGEQYDFAPRFWHPFNIRGQLDGF